MAKTKLFDNWTFSLQLPEPFDDPSYSGQKAIVFSRFNTVSTAKKATLHAPTLRAVLAYAKLANMAEGGGCTDGLGAVGFQGSTFHVSEYVSADKTDTVVFNANNGKFYAARFENGQIVPKAYTLAPNGSSGTALFFCLLPILMQEDEFRNSFSAICEQMRQGFPDMEEAFKDALILCDNAYRRIENSRSLGVDGVKTAIPTSGNVPMITQRALDNGTYSPTSVLFGEFTTLPENGCSIARAKIIDRADLVGKYQMSERTLTQREETMVPSLPDWYIVPREVVRVCEHAKGTTGSSQAMRNYMFRGNAGTGKTMGAQAIAAGLHLPYTLMTCNANTEITDLIGQFIPDSEGARQQGTRTGELPRLSDIVMHPPSVYETLTGEYDESKTEDDVLQKLVEVAVGKLCEKDSSQHIRYVDSPLLEAIRYGYVCELQEPSCIANPGVLVGLNALLDNCQMITLPTGEQVRRHPDTVIIVTTNSDYAGCRDMNQSIISRMDLIYDIESPDLNTMVKRVMNVTGFNDEQEATKMAVVVRDIAERCRQTMITDGSCGMRELKSWVQSVMITKDPYESALSTVIASASADPDNRAELISSCLRPQYTETI